MDDTTPTFGLAENPGQTVEKLMRDIGKTETIVGPKKGGTSAVTHPFVVTVPKGRTVQDLTNMVIAAAEFHKPLRRRGTARLSDLQSLIDWANRFKGPSSALFVDPAATAPALQCIADYHGAGPVSIADDGDPTASHCAHRAIYSFPLSKEWHRWMAVSDNPLDKDDMGEFIEANAKDVMDPTPALLTLDDAAAKEPWETRLMATARQIEGRYGQLHQLLAMSRQFQVHEKSNLTVTSNRDTGEQTVQFVNEHSTPDGQPLKLPNLIIIAIPVFDGGAPYRLTVRFRYRKIGGTVKFIFSIYDPQRAFDKALNEAVTEARDKTELPLFRGGPES